MNQNTRVVYTDSYDTLSYHTVGLKKDGTVVAVGWSYYGQCNVEDWRDIVQVSLDIYQTVGLKKDGTVVAVGRNGSGECEVEDWDLDLEPNSEDIPE